VNALTWTPPPVRGNPDLGPPALRPYSRDLPDAPAQR